MLLVQTACMKSCRFDCIISSHIKISITTYSQVWNMVQSTTSQWLSMNWFHLWHWSGTPHWVLCVLKKPLSIWSILRWTEVQLGIKMRWLLQAPTLLWYSLESQGLCRWSATTFKSGPGVVKMREIVKKCQHSMVYAYILSPHTHTPTCPHTHTSTPTQPYPQPHLHPHTHNDTLSLRFGLFQILSLMTVQERILLYVSPSHLQVWFQGQFWASSQPWMLADLLWPWTGRSQIMSKLLVM